MKRRLALACLMAVFLFSSLRAEAQDDQYIRIYRLIQEGDAFKSSAQPAPALEKYLDAEKQLLQFQKVYRDWNSNVVKYRLGYLANAIADISAKNPNLTLSTNKVIATNVSASPQAPVASSSELQNQLDGLQSQVLQLQTDKGLLESKLREALRVQPATADPRAVVLAEQEIKTLQKENELLKVNLAQRPAKAAPAVDSKGADQMKQQLAEANRQAAEQGKRVATLAAENTVLQKKLASVPANWNASNIEATQKALEETNRRLAEQTGLAAQYSLEKSALQMRVKTLMTEAQVTAALRAENEVLKRQVAEFQAAPPSNSSNAALTEARAQITVLQLEKAALENRIKQVSPIAPTNNVAVAASASVDAARVKQLERERAELEDKLEAAQKELSSRDNKGAAARVEQLSGEVQVLRTRLAVMETQQIAYTPEELALLQKTSPQVADRNAGKKSSRDLPSGSMALVAEAQKDFAARRFDQAQEKYQQVLKQDDKNVYTLANLAAIQLELGQLTEAEKNISQALALAPDDAYTLSLLGFLKFRQNQFDAALDALGRAAKLDPQNAEIQNYLGLTLSQKGMRKAAESALRKAIALDPKYPSAHFNLAVICITQNPSDPAMARFHYQKALAAGLPPNPEMEKVLSRGNPSGVVP